MPRSSRHKSHKQSKHKEAKDYYSDSDEDVKMKERNNSKEEATGSSRAKDSNHSAASGEKRKLSSSMQLKEGKDSKDLGNGDVSEEYLSSKRRKDKVEGSGGSDRWNGGGGDEKIDVVGLDKGIRTDLEKTSKSKESKGSGESKSKGSKRHESSGEKEEKNTGSVVEKEEGRSGSKSESRRRSEKESGRKEMKEKERGYDRDKKVQESRREVEVRAADGDLPKKQAIEDSVEDRPGKRGRENAELSLQDDTRNPDLEKEVEKRIRRKREGSNDKERYQDSKVSDERHSSSRVDRGKDGKYKDGGSHGDKFQDSSEKDELHRDQKYREDVESDSRHRDDKYREDGDRENRRREDKYHEVGDKNDRRRDEKYRDDGERDGRRRGDKFREDSVRESKRRDDKYREDGDKDSRRDDRYYEDSERDDRHKDDKYREDGERPKEEKRRDEYERESRYRDGKQGDDVDREKRVKEAKYRDERSSRDRSGDKSDAKYTREESHISELHSRKLSRDGSPTYDDRARGKDDHGRKRTSDKEDHGDVRSRSNKDQRYDSEKRSSSSSRVDLVTDRGKSSSRNADRELTPSRMRHQCSPSSRDHHRASKQDEPKYREYPYDERVRHTVASNREYGNAAGVNEKIVASRSNDRASQKEDGHLGELSSERRLKLDSRTSPRQFLDKSPSSTATDRRHFSRSDVRRNNDVEESGQRSGGSRDPKDYAGKEGRGSREFIGDTQIGDEHSQGEGDSLAISSPFARPNHLSSSSKSLLPPLFRMSVDNPSNFGSSEDDCRLKFNNRPRRMGDPSMGRVQGSPWKGVPNWPSPMASPMPNGFMSFQHGPPPVGFHPVMQQFPSAPLFGMRPPMELGHPGIPYHITDPDRFSGHGRSMGWRNPVDDSIPPPLHGWDTNNASFVEESHFYGRPDWEPARNIPSSQGWEAPGDMWKGPKSEASMELPSISDKENQFSHSAMDVTSSACQPGQQTEQMESDVIAENVETVPSSAVLEKRTSMDIDPIVETTDISKLSQKSDTRLYELYLSMLDVSAELTEPELYSKCAITLESKSFCFPEESKIMYIEDAKSKQMNSNSNSNSNPPLFVSISDSVFQKAMTLYEKQKQNGSITSRKNSSPLGIQNSSFSNSDVATIQNPEDSKKTQELLAPAGDDTKPGANVKNCDVEVKLEEASTDAYSKFGETTLVSSNIPVKQEDAIFDTIMEEDSRLNDQQPEPEFRDSVMPLQSAAEPSSGDDLPVPTPVVVEKEVEEEGMWAGDRKVMEETIPDSTTTTTTTTTKCDSLIFSEVTIPNNNNNNNGCEVEMVKIESGSVVVNLSRIHHSPENTH